MTHDGDYAAASGRPDAGLLASPTTSLAPKAAPGCRVKHCGKVCRFCSCHGQHLPVASVLVSDDAQQFRLKDSQGLKQSCSCALAACTCPSSLEANCCVSTDFSCSTVPCTHTSNATHHIKNDKNINVTCMLRRSSCKPTRACCSSSIMLSFCCIFSVRAKATSASEESFLFAASS